MTDGTTNRAALHQSSHIPRISMNHRHTLALTLLSAALLAACSSVPVSNARLDQARNDFRSAQADPRAQTLASAEMKQAQEALNRAHLAWTQQDDTPQVDHFAYVASQRVAIARETMNLRTAEQYVGNAGAARSDIRLAARTQEADAAQRAAELAQRNAEAAQRTTAVAKADSLEAQRVAVIVMDQNRQLQDRLRDLNAQATPRGLVITLGDVLFDTDQARLRPNGERMVAQLAAVLKEYPARNVLIEGFTDSTGSNSHNQSLSGRRADAVRLAFQNQGIAMSRISAQGLGEGFPVASNDSSEGRQLNRRVEIVLSDEQGRVMAR